MIEQPIDPFPLTPYKWEISKQTVNRKFWKTVAGFHHLFWLMKYTCMSELQLHSFINPIYNVHALIIPFRTSFIEYKDEQENSC